MICFYLLGWASLEELEAHIEKLKFKSAEGQSAQTKTNLVPNSIGSDPLSDRLSGQEVVQHITVHVG